MNVIRAELAKLRTLPITTFTITGTIAVALLIAIALERSGEPVDVVPYVQAGFVLLGIIPVAHEHAGRQFSTTLLAVPARGQLLIGKTVATLITLVLTAIATALAQSERSVGAAAYLTLIGLLAYTVALLIRHLVPAVVGMLCLVLIVSLLLAAVTEHARWLPDRAAAELYRPTDSVLTATTGTLVIGAWIAVLAAVAIRRFHRRDG
ncbi:hypothetical protein GCM10009745_22370 [Kribbella yunnanensis]|uniref:ABC transporter permease n=1 Tax=Kribbella yunnanensis TaxID=190194 RepID=A0ABN2GX76_9ACTN